MLVCVLFIRLMAMSTYLGFKSNPIKLRLFFLQTTPTVPAPENGSRIVPFLGHPANTQGKIKSSGKVAKCAPLNGCVGIIQTERLFLKLYLLCFNPSILARPGVLFN